MKRVEWLFVVALMSGLAVGCGDDDTGGGVDAGPGTDSGGVDSGPVEAMCPSGDTIPDEEGLMGPCCARSTNDTAAPTFRISGLSIASPASLASTIVRSALRDNLDQETFNWLIEVTDAAADGDVTVRTGFGQRNADATFSFTEGAAPGPGDPNRWDPLSVTATLSGEMVSAPPIDGVFSVPILDEATGEPSLELPLQAFELLGATMSEERNCVGLRTGPAYDTSQGMIRTFITIEDAMAANVVFGPIDTTLCKFIAGLSGDGVCTDTAQSEWMVKPDAICTAGTCTDSCDPDSDCNAWTITGGFSAHAVTIN